MTTEPVRIFIAYSSKDLAFKEEIRKRLKPLLRAGKVTVWDNYDIEGGAEWDAVIREKLDASDLILLLLSPDALDSDYFYEVEAPIALRRHEAGEALAVGVLLRPCPLKHTPFELARYELLPKKGYPVTDPHWASADAAYLSVFEEIDLLLEKIVALREARKAREQAQLELADEVAKGAALKRKKRWIEAHQSFYRAVCLWKPGFLPEFDELEKQRRACWIEAEAQLIAEAIEQKIPFIGKGIDRVTFTKWLQIAGASVDKGEALCEVETEKVSQELYASVAGHLIQVAKEGDDLPIGAVFAKIVDETSFLTPPFPIR